MRTSESKGYEQLYDSSAPFEPEVRNRSCSTMCANFGFGALAQFDMRAGSHKASSGQKITIASTTNMIRWNGIVP